MPAMDKDVTETMMKTRTVTVLRAVTAMLLGAALCGQAWAGPGGHGGGGHGGGGFHGGGHGGGFHGGGYHGGYHGGGFHGHGRVIIGGGYGYGYGGWYDAPWYGYGYAPGWYGYYDGAYPAPAPVATQPSGAVISYYCANPQGYYPSVRECPSGWQQVQMQPPSQ